jgi:Xaa-Pro dipeptidase
MRIAEWRKIPRSLAVSEDEYRGRLARVQAALAERGLGALLLHGPENLCYLTGFQTPGYYFVQALIVPAEGAPKLVTRHLELGNAFAYSWLSPDSFIAYLDQEDPVDVIVAVLAELGLARGRIGIEKQGYSTLPIAAYERIVAAHPSARFVEGSGLVERFRAVKSPAEIAHIRRACHISSIATRAAVEHCRAGMTEHALAAHVAKALTENGAEYAGLPLFLSSGARTFIRHAVPSAKVIEQGDNVLVELTGVVWRYAGPLFRTLSVGPPGETLLSHSRVARDMLDALIETIRPGLTSHEVNLAAIEAARRGGADVSVQKRAGYSVGLNFPPDWGEGVFLDLRSGSQTVLEAGMVFHLPQTMRVGESTPTAVSETVLVTEDGCEVLTDFDPRDLVIID